MGAKFGQRRSSGDPWFKALKQPSGPSRVFKVQIRHTSIRSIAAILTTAALVVGISGVTAIGAAAAQSTVGSSLRLANSVLPTVANHELQPVPTPDSAMSLPLTLTLTLNRSSQSGFDAYLNAVQNPSSSSYRRFLKQSTLTRLFGPTEAAYNSVLSWLHSEGFALVEGSTDHLTITVRGNRSDAVRAFDTPINTYMEGSRDIYANTKNPELPATIASEVHSVTGLSDESQPTATPASSPRSYGTKSTSPDPISSNPVESILSRIPSVGGVTNIGTPAQPELVYTAVILAYLKCYLDGEPPPDVAELLDIVGEGAFWQFFLGLGIFHALAPSKSGVPNVVVELANFEDCLESYAHQINFEPAKHPFANGPSAQTSITQKTNAARTLVSSTTNPQKIGLLEFDTYNSSDVSNWLTLQGAGNGAMSQLSEVNVNGGVSSPGSAESEVLLDIDTVFSLDPAASTDIVVYDAPPSTSFETMFNSMIGDGDTVISNSWSQCEDQTTLAEAQSIDSILAEASAVGVSVLNGTGDEGSTCADGSTNTIGVPSDSPNATAVGGTSPKVGLGDTYAGESWWNGTTATPPTGQGGYGVSKYFARPSYQSGLTTTAGRSVPDLSVDADPNYGIEICQQDAGGCPDGRIYGGTSMATPLLAAITAALNQALGSNMGSLNATLYPLAGTSALHSAASMGTDFAHVGLGSPNVGDVYAALDHLNVGQVSATESEVAGFGAPSDGSSEGLVSVDLRDANGLAVPDKTVTLTPVNGSAVVTPASQSTDENGTAIFTVTDTVPETVNLTATDTTDGIALSTQPALPFGPPPATAGGISANPSSVANDGTSAADITVTLQNAKGQGAEGKTITLSDGATDAQITPTGATPGVTNSSGVATFTATDTQAETVTFTAVDTTDGNLPVPGSSTVTYSGDASSSCNSGAPVAENGATLAVPESGFPTGPRDLNSCDGIFGMAFDGNGDLYAADQFNGDIYKFPPGGGAASPSTLLSGSSGAEIDDLTFGTDGELYAVEPDSGSVVQLDTNTGATLRTVASGFTSPAWIATDPLTGDLFVSPGGSGTLQSNDIERISNPSGTNPQVSTYVTDPNSWVQIAFAPNGTLYAITRDNRLVSIGGTNTTQPATESTITNVPSGSVGLVLGPIGSDGSPTSVYVTGNGDVSEVALPSGTVTQLATGSAGVPVDAKAGPDGCIYGADNSEVIRVTSVNGNCDSTAASGPPQIVLSGPGVVNPSAGSQVTFTANLSNVSDPAGTPILFAVTGANTQVKLVDANSNGLASFTYSALHPGTDTVTAATTVGSATPVSNQISFTWGTGKDTSFLTLNGSQEIGAVGNPATIDANLLDISQDPPAPINGASVTVLVGAQSCTITTDATGSGSCQINPMTAGLLTVAANYGGSGSLTSSSATNSFFAGGPSTTSPPIAPAFTSAASDTVPAGTAFAFSVTTTGSPTPSITLATGSSLPPGVTLTDNGNGTATLAGTSSVPAGDYTFTIQAANGVSPNATQAFALDVTNTNVATTTSLVSSLNPSVRHQSVTFSATVTPKSGAGVPTGSITFSVDGKARPAVNLSGGKAVIKTSALSIGAHKISASYSGGGGYSGSPSPVLTQRVKAFGAPASISVENGSDQSTAVKTPFSQPLSAQVTDAFGNPVSGAVVNFKAPSSGASGVFSNGKRTTNVKTGTNGVATTSTFTANAKAGGPYSVVATTGPLTVNFGLTNTIPSKIGLSIIPDQVTVGGQSTPAIQATVSNQGSGRTTETLVVTDYLQTGMSFTGGYAITGWQCTFQSQKAICSYTKSIPPGGSADLVLYLDVAASNGTMLSNIAVLTPGGQTVTSQFEAGDF